jgi:hypothetical protein
MRTLAHQHHRPIPEPGRAAQEFGQLELLLTPKAGITDGKQA